MDGLANKSEMGSEAGIYSPTVNTEKTQELQSNVSIFVPIYDFKYFLNKKSVVVQVGIFCSLHWSFLTTLL